MTSINIKFYVTDVYVTTDNEQIISRAVESIKIWNADTGQLIRTLNAPSNITSICVMPNNRYIVSSHVKKIINIWDIQTGEIVKTFQTDDITSMCHMSDHNKHYQKIINNLSPEQKIELKIAN